MKIVGGLLKAVYIATIMYTVGVLLALLFMFFRWVRLIRLVHWDKFPHRQGKLIVVSNHPSILDVFLVPALFYRGFLYNPFRYRPIIAADDKNFFRNRAFIPLRPCMVSVPRGNLKGEAQAFADMEKILEGEGILVILGRGRDGSYQGSDKEISKRGVEMRPFPKTAARLLVKHPDAKVLCIGLRGTHKVLPNSQHHLVALWRLRLKMVHVIIGDLMQFSHQELSHKKALENITKKLFDEVKRRVDE